MKVIIDANIWISLLLSRGQDNTIYRAVQRATTWPFQLVLPQETITEIVRSIAKSHYLASRIPESDIEELLKYLSQIATIPPPLQSEQTRLLRDPGDDYLIAYGLIYECVYLITGDADLLVIKQIRDMQIVTALTFVNILPSRNH